MLAKDHLPDILSMVSDRGISAVVDASGSLLSEVLPYHPFLIKTESP